MNITAKCSSCQKVLSVGQEHAGKKIRCPACKGIVQLPKAKLASSSKPSPESPQAPATKMKQRPPEDAAQVKRSPKKRPKRQPKKRPRPASDDIWAAPLSSYSSPEIAEEDYEEYGLPPKKVREQQNGQRDGSGSSSGGKGPILLCVIACGVIAVIAIIGGVVGKSSPDIGMFMTYPAVIIGGLLNFGGSLKILGNAFEEDTMVGIMYLFVPFYALYFLFSRWDVNATAFLISLIGSFAMIIGIVSQAMLNVGA